MSPTNPAYSTQTGRKGMGTVDMVSDARTLNRSLFLTWLDQVEQAYPNKVNMEDKAAAMICNVLKDLLLDRPVHEALVAHDDTIFHGLLGYIIWVPDGDFQLTQFGVLHAHREKGIGSALIERVKAESRYRGVPIFANSVLELAFPRLVKAGFWRAGGPNDNPIYKWSDLPAHQNNKLPGDN
jgi:GNAT superfamily N-acetyltransferase